MTTFTKLFKKKINTLICLSVAIFTFLFIFLGYRYSLWSTQDMSLFPWTKDYLMNFVDKPGYLGMYITYFIVQFYYYPWLGALIITALLFGVFCLARKIFILAGFSNLFAYVGSSLVLALFLGSEITSGSILYLCVGSFSSLSFLFLLMRCKKWISYIVLLFATIFMYYIFGSYVYLFACLCLLHFFGIIKTEKHTNAIWAWPKCGKSARLGPGPNGTKWTIWARPKWNKMGRNCPKWGMICLLVGLIVVMPFVCKEFCAPMMDIRLWLNLFPNIEIIIFSSGRTDLQTTAIDLKEYAAFAVIPILILTHFVLKIVLPNKKWLRLSMASVLILYSVTSIALTYRFFIEKNCYLEYLAHNEKWIPLLEYCNKHWEKHPKNAVAPIDYQFAQYTKLALLKTKQINQTYFKYYSFPYIAPLFFNVNRESPLFYSLLLNELGLYMGSFHSCTRQLPINYLHSSFLIKLIVKNNHALGNYEANKIHLNLLSATLFHKDFARKYKSLENKAGTLFNGKNIDMINGSKDTSLCELSPGIIDIDVRVTDITGYQNPILVDYKMTLALLRKDINYIFENIHLYKEMNYSYLPIHIEEAVLVYLNYNMPGSPINSRTIVGKTYAGFTFRPETLARCEYFMKKTEMQQFGKISNDEFLKEFEGTYWIYHLYGTPQHPTM